MSRHANASAPRAHRRRGGRTNTGSWAADASAERGQEAPRPHEPHGPAERGRDGEVHADVEPGPGHERAEPRPGEPAERERGMEAREDRAPVAALDRHAVHVHRHVAASPCRRPAANASAANAASDGANATTPIVVHASANAARVARRLPARAASAPASGIAMIAPTGQEREREAELAVRQREAVADRRDARRPGAEQQAVEEEDRGDRSAGAAGVGHARTTSIPRSR